MFDEQANERTSGYKRAHTEAEIIGALKQLDAGRTAAEMAREVALDNLATTLDNMTGQSVALVP